jgi:hypothetical protein
MIKSILLLILEKIVVDLAKIGILKLLNKIQWKQHIYMLIRLLSKQIHIQEINKALISNNCYAVCKKIMFITLQSAYVISGMIFLIARSFGCNIFLALVLAASVVVAVTVPYRMLLKEAKL